MNSAFIVAWTQAFGWWRERCVLYNKNDNNNNNTIIIINYHYIIINIVIIIIIIIIIIINLRPYSSYFVNPQRDTR